VENEQETQKSYDISQILSVSRGDQGFVQTMIRMFVVQTPLYIGKIVDHYEKGNYTEMGEEAHKLKPSIYAMGMNDLKRVVSDIVNAGRNNQVTDELADQIHTLKTSSAKIIQELKKDYGL
jgi:HPt (histidine-containing phosphotransfer) domain-containing protein